MPNVAPLEGITSGLHAPPVEPSNTAVSAERPACGRGPSAWPLDSNSSGTANWVDVVAVLSFSFLRDVAHCGSPLAPPTTSHRVARSTRSVAAGTPHLSDRCGSTEPCCGIGGVAAHPVPTSLQLPVRLCRTCAHCGRSTLPCPAAADRCHGRRDDEPALGRHQSTKAWPEKGWDGRARLAIMGSLHVPVRVHLDFRFHRCAVSSSIPPAG
jgi:hypothetical protein